MFYQRRVPTCLAVVCLLSAAVWAEAGEEPVIPMRLEVEFDDSICIVHENVPLKVRIVNPNDFPITLRGFVMGYIEPEVHVLLGDGETLRLCHGSTASAWTSNPVTIPAKGVLEKHRFLCNDNLASLLWPGEPGLFELRAKTHLSTARRKPEGERFPIEWDMPIAHVRVELPDLSDRRAWDFLGDRLLEFAKDPTPGVRDVALPRVRIHCDFLERFPESRYAPQIRWELAKLLQDELGNERIPDEEVPHMVELFDECLTFCLDKGGAYAEEFVWWDMDRGGNHAVDLAREYKRCDLLTRIVQGIDEKHPEDEAAKLYRQVLLLAETESIEKARPVAAKLAERLPESRYVRSANSLLDWLERKKKDD